MKPDRQWYRLVPSSAGRDVSEEASRGFSSRTVARIHGSRASYRRIFMPLHTSPDHATRVSSFTSRSVARWQSPLFYLHHYFLSQNIRLYIHWLLCSLITKVCVIQREFSDDCVFNEMIEQHHYNTYSSTKYSNHRRTVYLALNKRGTPRR